MNGPDSLRGILRYKTGIDSFDLRRSEVGYACRGNHQHFTAWITT